MTRPLLPARLLAATLLAGATLFPQAALSPARAERDGFRGGRGDDFHGGRGAFRGHGGFHHGAFGRGTFDSDDFGRRFGAPPVYYRPAPFYAPPPVYYAPYGY